MLWNDHSRIIAPEDNGKCSKETLKKLIEIEDYISKGSPESEALSIPV